MARFSGVLAPYIGGPLHDIWQPLPSLIFGVCGVGTAILTLLLPETLDRPLPDTITDIEGKQGKEDEHILKEPEDLVSINETNHRTISFNDL